MRQNTELTLIVWVVESVRVLIHPVAVMSVNCSCWLRVLALLAVPAQAKLLWLLLASKLAS